MKYRNKKITIDGITFDSIHEGNRYRELKLLEKAGKISVLRLQGKFQLIRPQYANTAERYTKVVEDTKGMRTKDYIIKRKLMLQKYGIKIKEV